MVVASLLTAVLAACAGPSRDRPVDVDAGTSGDGMVVPVEVLAGMLASQDHVDGTGPAARFRRPTGIAVDSAGNLYVADSLNRAIRQVTAAGAVTTLAGNGLGQHADGPSASARFVGADSVAVDQDGNVYVADYLTIRKVTRNGDVTTLAGSPQMRGNADGVGSAARFDNPTGLAVDAAGNVFVADSSNHTIRKITSAGVVTTLAGKAGEFGHVNGTGAEARFAFPASVAIDGAGNLYVAEEVGTQVRKVTPDGVVTTVFTQFDPMPTIARGIVGVAIDGGGNLYVLATDFPGSFPLTGHTVHKITPQGVVSLLAGSPGQPGAVDGTGDAARFYGPRGISVDRDGNVYIADTENHTVRKITSAGVVTTLAGLASAGSRDGTGGAARLFEPGGVAAGLGGHLYIADTGNHTIRKLAPDGKVTTFAGLAGTPGGADGSFADARFRFPSGIAVDGSGNVYVADTGNNAIRRISPSGNVSTLAGRPGGPGTATYFQAPTGLALDGAGNLYVADTGNNAIRKITFDGVVTTLAGSPPLAGDSDGTGSAASFTNPRNLVVDSAGTVYVGAYGGAVRKISPGGVVTTLRLDVFTDTPIAVDRDDRLYTAEYAYIVKIAPGAVVRTSISPRLYDDARGAVIVDDSLVVSVRDAVVSIPLRPR